MMLNRLIAFSLRRRTWILAGAALLCAYGLYALEKLPVDILPDLNRPTVAVMTEAPGLQPEEIEAQISTPLEAALSGAAGSAVIRSVSSSGFALITIEFGWGSDLFHDRQAIQERLNQAAPNLPGNVKPVMLADASLMGEILLIGVVPEHSGEAQLIAARNFADWTLRPKLLALPGVAQVSVIGGRRPQVQVLADPLAMREHSVTFPELKNALQQAGARGSGGVVVESDRETAVTAAAGAITAEAIAGARVKSADGLPVKVSDVAAVRSGARLPRGDAAVNGHPALILAVQKQPQADTLRVTEEVDRALADLRGSLPTGITLEPRIFRQADFIRSSISNVSESLLTGAALAALILVLFLLRVRPVLVTLTAIPVSLLATAAAFKLFGQSINCMTLGGIAIAIGELVDDAIVDVENIRRRIDAAPARPPHALFETILAACVEIRSAIVYGTALVLLALLPLFFLPGLDGRLFAPLAGAYIVSIFMSLLVALTVTPALSALLVTKSQAVSDAPILRACKRVARTLYGICMPRPVMVLALVIAAVCIAGVAAARMGRDYLPPLNESTLTVQLRAWPEISLAESNRLAGEVEALLLSVPEVRAIGRRTGRAELDEHAEGLHSSELDVSFWGPEDDAGAQTPSSARTPPAPPFQGGEKEAFQVGETAARAKPGSLRARDVVLREIDAKLRGVPVLAVALSRPISHRIDHLLSGVRAPVVVKIRGADIGTLRRLASRTEAAMRAVSGVTQIFADAPLRVPRLSVRPKRAALAQYGFTTGGLNEILNAALQGEVLARPLSARQPAELLLWSAEKYRRTPDALRDLPLVSPEGAYVRLAGVADVVELEGPTEIRHENGVRQVAVSCAVAGRDLGGAVEELQRTLSAQITPALPAGYTLDVGGEFQARTAATRFLVPAALLALSIAVLLLFAHFRALAPVLLVLINVPFAFIGGVVALLLARESLSLASLVGFITLAGIAGRNGVLLISHYYQLITKEGLPFNRDTVVRGSQERVAPVLMTALTTGLALIPLLLNRGAPGREILYPVALVVIGGLLSTTLLDFAVTPALFLRFCRTLPPAPTPRVAVPEQSSSAVSALEERESPKTKS